jgi:hypothetical protein
MRRIFYPGNESEYLVCRRFDGSPLFLSEESEGLEQCSENCSKDDDDDNDDRHKVSDTEQTDPDGYSSPVNYFSER